jgi:FKBP-type peptidyl-prolyl cis-trans isomerase
LKREDLVTGSGEALADGQAAIVHYSGWIYDPAAPDNKGAKYDTSRDRPQPYQFTVGAGQVIQGWDIGVVGMQVGGQRRLIIPPDLGYGAAGAPGGDVPIPPNAVLVLDLELVGIEPSIAPPQ